MLLTVDTASQWLLDHRLLEPADIVDRGLVIADAGRRNRNLKVTRRSPAKGFLIKQAPEGGYGHGSTIATEAAFYRACTHDSTLAEIRGFMPSLIAYDEPAQALVIELLGDAVPLWAFWTSDEPMATRTNAARSLGEALAILHTAPAVTRTRQAWMSSADVPWIMGIHRPGPRLFEHISAANLRALKILQHAPHVGRTLDELRHAWCASAAIHNDIKSDNVLVWNTGDEVHLRIIDWELVQHGDPLWDVAGVFCDVWVHWVASIPSSASKTMEQAMAESGHTLSNFFPAVRAFWSAYRQRALPDRTSWEDALRRTILLAAARLIQSAYEQAQDAPELPNPSVITLQLASNVMQDADSAQLHLLGIPPSLSVAARR